MSLRFQVPHELFPVEHHFTDVGGARIHYVDERRPSPGTGR